MEQRNSPSCVVAVTRNGWGDIWLFPSREAADLHPIVQYGDVICEGPERIMRQYTFLELPHLLRKLGDEIFRKEVLVKLGDPAGRDAIMERYRGRIWDMMVAQGGPPPDDPAKIVAIVGRDRKLSIEESRGRNMEKRMTKENTAAEGTTTAAGAADAGKAPKEPKAPKDTLGGFKLDAKITLLCDEEGKPYGAENNPKRVGSKSAERFAFYTNDMTVEEASKAGVQAADFQYDVNKKYIRIQ